MEGSGWRLLADVTTSDVVTTPFAHVLCPAAVSGDVYGELSATFPSLARITAGRAFGSNMAVRRTAVEVAADPETTPRWRDFFAYHTSVD